MFYVYELIDPRKNQPFYVGKGKGRRAATHLWEIPETRNVYKENIIASIRADGLEPEIKYVADNIIDESIAYNIEASLIKRYGRKGYDKNGILSNICEDARPPNHKGKTYEEIYGSKERADEQRKLRSELQKKRGGYGPKKHSVASKALIAATSTGNNNANSCKITEEELLIIGKDFCEFFEYKISRKKWEYWAKKNNIPFLYRTFRFNNELLLTVFSNKFNAKIYFDSLLWFYNSTLNKNFRCFDWELKIGVINVPDGFVRGRGPISK